MLPVSVELPWSYEPCCEPAPVLLNLALIPKVPMLLECSWNVPKVSVLSQRNFWKCGRTLPISEPLTVLPKVLMSLCQNYEVRIWLPDSRLWLTHTHSRTSDERTSGGGKSVGSKENQCGVGRGRKEDGRNPRFPRRRIRTLLNFRVLGLVLFRTYIAFAVLAPTLHPSWLQTCRLRLYRK